VTLRQELREATRAAHDRLELGVDVLQRCASTASYAALLSGFRSIYGPLELALGASPATRSAVPDWARRHKSGWLDEDLAALGEPVPSVVAAVPRIARAEDVIGTLYVMEGATLGGALVVRELERSFPVPPPHRFFASYGSRRGAMWHAFRGHVDALERRGGDPAAVVAAASATFDAVERACLQPSS